MLKYRIITAFVFILLMFGMMWELKPPIFALTMLVFFVAGSWELSRLIGVSFIGWRIAYVALVLLGIYATYFIPQLSVLFMSIPAWLWITYVIGKYEQNHLARGMKNVFIKGICGILIVVPCWKSLAILQGISPFLLLIAFILIWSVDTGAYFSGRHWGKRFLAPRISPKKTWEGFWGGIFISVILMTIFSFFIPLTSLQRIFFIILSVLTALFAVIGDLFISLLKRQAGVKDSGRLLPGHGGLLDRVDSTLSALPIFTIGILFIKL